MKILVVAILLLLILNGCSTITITDSDGVTSYEREFGFISLNVHPTNRTIVADVIALGYLSTPIGTSFGYSKHSIAFLPEKCNVVLWVKTYKQLTELQKLVEDFDSICPVIIDKQRPQHNQ